MLAALKVVFATALVIVCAAGKPIETKLLVAGDKGRLMARAGGATIDPFPPGNGPKDFKQAGWFLLGTKIKWEAGGYLAHHAAANPEEEVYLGSSQAAGVHWTIESTSDQPDNLRQPWNLHVRIIARGGEHDGCYLGLGSKQSLDTPPETAESEPQTRTSKLRRVILVRDRADALVFEVINTGFRYLQ